MQVPPRQIFRQGFLLLRRLKAPGSFLQDPEKAQYHPVKVASQQPLRADVQARSEDCPDPRSHFHFLLRTAIPDRWQCTGQTVHFPGSDN